MAEQYIWRLWQRTYSAASSQVSSLAGSRTTVPVLPVETQREQVGEELQLFDQPSAAPSLFTNLFLVLISPFVGTSEQTHHSVIAPPMIQTTSAAGIAMSV
jgi:hypothetical protein